MFEAGLSRIYEKILVVDEGPPFSREKTSSLPKIPETKEEKILLKYLSSDPIHIDNISKLSKLGAVSVSSTLTMMEIKGWVKNIGGQNYIII